MEDLKLMTECECMCVLQAKPISLEEDTQGDLILAGGPSPGDSLQLLLKRGWVISTELRRIGQKLAQDRWARVHSMSVRLTCHARSMVSEYSAANRSPSQEMGQVSCPGVGLSGRWVRGCIAMGMHEVGAFPGLQLAPFSNTARKKGQ